jgi:hypothetical protein
MVYKTEEAIGSLLAGNAASYWVGAMIVLKKQCLVLPCACWWQRGLVFFYWSFRFPYCNSTTSRSIKMLSDQPSFIRLVSSCLFFVPRWVSSLQVVVNLFLTSVFFFFFSLL